MPIVTNLYIYPVKSLAGISLPSAELTERGLKYDREWMIVDEAGRFITQRECPKMATVRVSITKTHLILSHSEKEDLLVSLEHSETHPEDVTVWKDSCKAINEGHIASEWITQLLGEHKGSQLFLTRFYKPYKRLVDPETLREEVAHTSFADGYPFLVTSEESLAFLNSKLEEPVPMDRFRPNIVVKNVTAFQELQSGTIFSEPTNYSLGIRKPCGRCIITTMNQETGLIENPKEPLKTLVKLNPTNKNGAFFGGNAILLQGDGETISVGSVLRFDTH